MVQHHNNLLMLNESHPDIEFQNGGFGVKRTSNNFSRSPIDLTLEQTVDADAASQRTGIGTFTYSISARQRWSHSQANMVNFSGEADTMMSYHIASMSNVGNVVLCTYDTDVHRPWNQKPVIM